MNRVILFVSALLSACSAAGQGRDLPCVELEADHLTTQTVPVAACNLAPTPSLTNDTGLVSLETAPPQGMPSNKEVPSNWTPPQVILNGGIVPLSWGEGYTSTVLIPNDRHHTVALSTEDPWTETERDTFTSALLDLASEVPEWDIQLPNEGETPDVIVHRETGLSWACRTGDPAAGSCSLGSTHCETDGSRTIAGVRECNAWYVGVNVDNTNSWTTIVGGDRTISDATFFAGVRKYLPNATQAELDQYLANFRAKPVPQVLQLVIKHELGHTLGFNHESTGLMVSAFDHDAFYNDPGLTDCQLGKLRAAEYDTASTWTGIVPVECQ